MEEVEETEMIVDVVEDNIEPVVETVEPVQVDITHEVIGELLEMSNRLLTLLAHLTLELTAPQLLTGQVQERKQFHCDVVSNLHDRNQAILLRLQGGHTHGNAEV